MTPRERILAALHLKEPDQVPFADWIDDGIRNELAKEMGSEDIDDGQFGKKIGFDAISFKSFYDLCPLFDVTKEDDQGRVHYLGQGLIKSESDLDKMNFCDPYEEACYDDAKRFIDRYGKTDLALYAGMRLGMMPTIYSLGWMGFAEALYDNIGLVETVMDRYIEWHCVVYEKLQSIGFDFFFVCDDIAHKSGPMFSPQILREVFLPRIMTLANVISIPWVFHSDGDLTLFFDDLLTLGMNCINPIEPPVMDIKTVKEKYGIRVCLWGNIDLVYTLTRGTPEEVEAEVKQRIKEVGQGGGYILGSANSITDYCKVENVIAMAKAVKKYGKYPIDLV